MSYTPTEIEDKRKCILEEIVSSEGTQALALVQLVSCCVNAETYVASLRCLVHDFFDELFNGQIFKRSHEARLCSNIKILLGFHESFLAELKRNLWEIPEVSAACWVEDPNTGFLEFESFDGWLIGCNRCLGNGRIFFACTHNMSTTIPQSWIMSTNIVLIPNFVVS